MPAGSPLSQVPAVPSPRPHCPPPPLTAPSAPSPEPRRPRGPPAASLRRHAALHRSGPGELGALGVGVGGIAWHWWELGGQLGGTGGALHGTGDTGRVLVGALHGTGRHWRDIEWQWWVRGGYRGHLGGTGGCIGKGLGGTGGALISTGGRGATLQ